MWCRFPLVTRHYNPLGINAGTGKTTMLKQVVELAGAERIVALAPSSSAARTLQRETGLGTKTLQWFLTRYRDVGDGCADDETLGRAREALEGTLLVVDEASLVSMEQMHNLAQIAEATGIARVALVGDKAQLRAVEAGQPFRVLQKAGMETAVMDEVMRQRDESLKAAVLHMIDQKPELAIEELGPGVLEMDADELGSHAAALWLDLDNEAREATKVLAPTHVRRREITGAIREGLKAEGSLHGRTLEIERYVNLHLTRAQKGDLGNWREGDVAVFHADVYGVQAKSGDIFGVIGAQGEKVLLKHPDGKTRRVDPSKYLRYRVDLFETEAIELQAGERIRWTRNDKARSLLNGGEAKVLWIGSKSLRLQTADGRTLTLKHDDPQLHFIDHAWTSTVHAAQGITCDQVIAVLDANQGAIAGQAAFYVELTRARDNAVLLTDDRDGLVEALETAAGDELSALEAIGHQFQEDTHVAVAEKEAIPPAGLSAAKAWKEEARANLSRHIDACLAEREDLLKRARHPRIDENSALTGVEGHAQWRTRSLATVEAWRDEMGDEPGDGKADLLGKLVAFDDRLAAFNRDLRRHAQAAKAEEKDLVFYPGIDELLARGRTLVDTAPRPEEVPWDHLNFLEMATAAIEDHDQAVAEAEALALFDRVEAGLDAVRDERRTLRDLAQGQPLHTTEGYAAWRERAVAAIDAWQRAEVREGERERTWFVVTVRLEEALKFDDEVAVLLADWAAFENVAGERGTEAFDLAANDPLLTRVRRLVEATPEGETPPQALTGFLARHQARIEEREEAAARIGAALDDYASRHAKVYHLPESQGLGIMTWCDKTREAIDTWRAMTETGERDPALSTEAMVLEDLIAFEKRAFGIAVRLSKARGDDGKANPFLGAEGEALAADLRSLQTGLPHRGVLLSSLQEASRELDRHEVLIAERDKAAARIGAALDDYRSRHATLHDAPSTQARSIGTWCDETRDAIDTWLARTTADERDLALSDMAAVLKDIIAFEGCARDLRMRWNDVRFTGTAGGGTDPFLTPGGEALAADLRTLKANIPRFCVLLSSLQAASEELDRHETRIAEREKAAAAIRGALDDYRACHAPMLSADEQISGIRGWCAETESAIGAWRAMTETGARDPALSETAAVLEDIIAFEGRARDLHMRWNDAGIADTAGVEMDPFHNTGGEALAAALRSLQAGLPRHAVLLSSLQAASGELDRHEARIAEREKASARLAKAFDDYRACHEPMEETAAEVTRIRVWCHETQRAIGAWRAVTETDPALSETAATLEDLIAFEERARDLFYRWRIARIGGCTASPFLYRDDMTLAADLHGLADGLPRHAIMLHDLRPALEGLAEHERSVAEARELVERAAGVDDARRALLEREGRTSRPLNRRFNKAWKRWREAAEAVAAEIDAMDAALIARVDENGVASRVRAEYAASDRLDGLPGWLLARLHDNAVAAGATVHPAMTADYAGIMREMYRLEQSLKQKDPRRPVLRGEINRHNENHETRRRVASLLAELQAHHAQAASLDGAARRESLPLQQSLAWARWYRESRSLEERAGKVLTGGDYRTVLHDGQGTRQAFEEALALFGKTRAAHGEPDDSVRREQRRKEIEEMVRAQSRRRGRGLSM
ncbi:MAG: AAA family ATPase [bacterium]|nr:AAA family ATPase [bacterium]